MEQTSILFKIKDTADLDNHRILEIFFKAWVDEISVEQVLSAASVTELQH